MRKNKTYLIQVHLARQVYISLNQNNSDNKKNEKFLYIFLNTYTIYSKSSGTDFE